MAEKPKIFQCLDCPDGVQIFATEEELMTHKWDMIRLHLSREHMSCHICGLKHRTFEGLIRHYQLSHPAKQKLNCPGCQEIFPRLHLLMNHIECNECPKLRSDAVEKHRLEKAVAGAAALAKSRATNTKIFDVGNAMNTNGYGQYMGINVPLPKAKPRVEAGVGSATSASGSTSAASPGKASVLDSSTVRDFLNGDSKLPDLLTEDTPDAESTRTAVLDVWSGQDMLGWGAVMLGDKTAADTGLAAEQPNETPEPKPAPKPAPKPPSLPKATKATGNLRGRPFGDGFPDPDNMNSVQHDIQRYKNPYTARFNCPHMSCRRMGKTFKTAGSFHHHLQSDSHTAMRVQCPMCSRYFRSIEALTQHCESQSVRCHLRDSEEYAQFLDTLTGGVVGIDGRHVDLTVSYGVQADAAKLLEKDAKLDKASHSDGWVL